MVRDAFCHMLPYRKWCIWNIKRVWLDVYCAKQVINISHSMTVTNKEICKLILNSGTKRRKLAKRFSKLFQIINLHLNISQCEDQLIILSSWVSQCSTLQYHHIIIRAAFVCLCVCLFVPLLLRGPLTDLRQTLWVYVGGPRNCPWGVNGSTGQTSLFRSRRHQAETTPLQKDTASFAEHCVFCPAKGTRRLRV